MKKRLLRPSARLWLLVLLLALGGLLAVIEQRQEPAPGPVPEGSAGEPDFYLESARMTRFDESGRAYQRLVTPRLTHTPADDVIRARTPEFRFYDDDGRTWYATSDSGLLGPGGKRLTLSGNATLEAPEEGWKLATDTLLYDTQLHHAWSESEAQLSQHAQRVSGRRFDAWLDESRLRLTDNVRGVHPPIDAEQGT